MRWRQKSKETSTTAKRVIIMLTNEMEAAIQGDFHNSKESYNNADQSVLEVLNLRS